jgi:hypothetical protein
MALSEERWRHGAIEHQETLALMETAELWTTCQDNGFMTFNSPTECGHSIGIDLSGADVFIRLVGGDQMETIRSPRASIALLLAALLVALLSATPESSAGVMAKERVFEGPVDEADCGLGSKPETGLQGQVPYEDRQSGRSQKGYWCNMKLLGQHQGVGTSWQMAWHGDCAYYDTFSYSGEGVAVLDVSKTRNPELSTKLTSPSMLGPWESLKVNERRELLAGVGAWAPAGNGPLFFDVYDVSEDCAQPELLASLPIDLPSGHEGNWAQDGKTYYGSSLASIAAIDVTDPAQPGLITVMNRETHGLATSADGNRLYLAAPSAPCGNGLQIIDVSEVQAREPDPQTEALGEVCWEDGSTAQHPIPVTIKGDPYVIFVDEGGAGAARLIDISDETKPRVVSKFKLMIHLPVHQEHAQADTAGNGVFGYEAHYCNVDRLVEPTVLGCGYFQSGIRVFDIRNPMKPKEIAYFNPPARVGEGGQLRGSEHASNPLNSPPSNMTADWCSAQVRFIPERAELWTTCQDNGFLTLKFTNGVWPFKQHRKQAGPTSSSG